MYLAVSACLALALIIAVGQLVERRRRRRITEWIAACGGRVVGIQATIPSSAKRRVRYIGPHGELREALVFGGEPTLCDDRPFQLVLREKYERERSDEMLRELVLAGELSRLPGFEAYKAIILELAAGSVDSVSIPESATDLHAQRRFAPVLQSVEAAGISSQSGEERLLDLVANGKNIMVRWSLEGESPHRSLVLSAVRPRE